MEFNSSAQEAIELRTYKTPIGELPSVTTILQILDKPGLRMWYGQHGVEKAKEMLQAAASRGTLVHEYIQQRIAGEKKPFLLQEYEGYALSWEKWWETMRITPKFSEHMVYSEAGYAGTLDFLGVDDKGIWRLIDWKTSSAFYVANVLQASAYAMAVYRRDLLPPDTTCIPMVVRLKADGGKAETLCINRWENVKLFYTQFLYTKELWQISRDWKSYCEKDKQPRASRKSKMEKSSPKSTCQGPFCACAVNSQPCGENTLTTIG